MKVPISGQITGFDEVANVMQVARNNAYGGYIWTNRFEKGFAKYMQARFGIMTNSGSSANLLALAALELPKGSHILTTALNFPTTVNPIIQLGHIPIFIDSDPKTLNAIYWNPKEYYYDACIFAHTLGNPVDIPESVLPIIEDCCDAVGSTIDGQPIGKRGVMATVSFYPAHHITTGEGGMVLTDSPKLKRVIESYRDWGRDCWCEPGKDNTCGTRFDRDYDHKYTYSRIGYNLKASDFQAAVGVAQLDKLPEFVRIRRRNWEYLRAGLDDLPLEFVERAPNTNPSWFGFAFLTPERNKLARYLDNKGIGNRPIMGGNLLRQPAYYNIEKRIVGSLDGANKIHEQGLWIGCFPGITPDMMDYTIEVMRAYFGQ